MPKPDSKIITREPKKKLPNTFANIRRPHPASEYLGLADSQPIEPPVVSTGQPVGQPVGQPTGQRTDLPSDIPTDKPSHAPTSQSADEQANQAIDLLINRLAYRSTSQPSYPPTNLLTDQQASGQSGPSTSTPSQTPTDEPTEARPRWQQLEHTHTSAEQHVYSAMYRQTLSLGKREARFSVRRLQQSTVIQGDKTIRDAVQGLLAKQSIELVEKAIGSTPAKYRVRKPGEIFARRKTLGIEIDEDTRRITAGKPARRSVRHWIQPVTQPVDLPVGLPVNSTAWEPVEMTAHDNHENSVAVGSTTTQADRRREDLRELLDTLADEQGISLQVLLRDLLR